MLRKNPLAPAVYLRRNASKTIPLTIVIVLAIMLICGIVSMMDSIPYSIKTIYRYSQNYLGVTPRGDPELTPKIKERLEKESPVKIGHIMVCRASEMIVRSIVGKWPFVVLALSPEDTDFYLENMKTTKIEGRKPKAGAAEAIISRPIATNLGLKIGSNLLGPELMEAYSPNNVKVVGIAETDQWLALIPLDYHKQYHFPPIDVLGVFAANPAEQPKLDHWALKAFEGERARLFAYERLEKDTNEMFRILYSVLNVVIGTLVLVIAFMMGMLMNIYQSQRLQEFGLLQALGYARKQLLRRVLGETIIVVFGGWVIGLALANSLLRIVKHVLMDPNAFALDTFDRMAYLYTVPVPIVILAVGVFTVMMRFRKFDPVSIVERRLV